MDKKSFELWRERENDRRAKRYAYARENSDMINVRDMDVEQYYVVNDVSKKLTSKTVHGKETHGESYILEFEDGTILLKAWDDKFKKVNSGGKRKSKRHNRKRNKSRRRKQNITRSRKNRRKSNSLH